MCLAVYIHFPICEVKALSTHGCAVLQELHSLMKKRESGKARNTFSQFSSIAAFSFGYCPSSLLFSCAEINTGRCENQSRESAKGDCDRARGEKQGKWFWSSLRNALESVQLHTWMFKSLLFSFFKLKVNTWTRNFRISISCKTCAGMFFYSKRSS